MDNERNLTECQSGEMSKNKSPARQFLYDLAAGYGIGVAFIIPGFSGGSLAAIFGIYERLVGAIAGIFRHFKESIVTLIPIFVGLCLGAVSLLYPLGWALSAFPLPTVCLFVGLALGGLPSVTENLKGRISAKNLLAFALPALVAVAVCFAPTGADIDLFSLDLGGYLLLFGVGAIGSSALVVPGISGSMLLLILGYYNPIIKVITEHFLRGEDMLKSVLILGSAGLGIVVGFIGISILMKTMLDRYKRGTYFAILGFIIGSIPTVFVSTAKDAGYTASTLPTNPWHWVVCALLLLVGVAATLLLVISARKRTASEEK